MSSQVLLYIMGGTLAALIVMVIAYVIINKALNKGERKYLRELRQGTKANTFSSEVIYIKLYMIYMKIPGIRRYLLKLRRRLEIINIQDEYQTRRQASSILTKALIWLVPLTIAIIVFTHTDSLLLSILLILELFIVEALMEGMVSRLDTKLLKQQIEFFAEIRHAYHEYNMVEEAIYQVSQDDEKEVSRQGEKIYEILISDDPEEELEKYYDIAPNSYLKEFAGISYLTREFGDRKTESGASLYLKNLNNITQELQIEILKRDKLDYVFQSLSFIAIAPIVFIQPLKNWSISNFDFTRSFYEGKLGFIIQMLIIILTFACYLLIRKVKDTNSKTNAKNSNNPWQEKLYKIDAVKKIVNAFIPKKKTKQYRKLTKTMKDAATKDKIEWIYINRMALFVLFFFVSIFLMDRIHKISIDYIYTTPTTNYNLISMSDKQEKEAMEVTEMDNTFLDMFKGQTKVTKEQIETKVRQSKYFADAEENEITDAVDRIYSKLQTINGEYLKWFEVLIALLFGCIRIYGTNLVAIFPKNIKKPRNGRRGNAVSNYYTYAYED